MGTIEDVCTACGERNPAGSAFCLYCGVYLGWDEASTADQPATRQAVPSAETSAYSSQNPTQPQSVQGQLAAQGQQPTVQAQPVAGWRSSDPPCPQCGQPNAVTLRFCSKCGTALRPTQPVSQVQRAAVPQTWWQRFRDPTDRRARREYRRSLPPLYRWRRVIIAVGLLVAVLVLLSLIGKDPVGWAKDKFYAVRGTLVVADPVDYAGSPPESVAKGYDPAALGSAAVDDAWATAWTPLAPLDGCPGKAAAKGLVSLTFKDPVRVRRLDVRAGLPADNAKRTLQFRPSVLLVMYEGRCSELQLKDISDLQQLKLDTGVPVKQLLVAVGATYPGRTDAAENLTALTSLAVLSRPR
ncbi:hypothetical protein ACFPJ1_17625 [Kribbella qitaiheensis]|uniref:hypothetical protein n=1 Tax=Kribbella qitaiheensis TaxID=1544730 RepID=UPI00360B430C